MAEEAEKIAIQVTSNEEYYYDIIFRCTVIKGICAHIREHKLQDPEHPNTIHTDEILKEILGVDEFKYIELGKIVKNLSVEKLKIIEELNFDLM